MSDDKKSETPILAVLRGIPFTGKTEFANKLVSGEKVEGYTVDNSLPWVRVSERDIKKMGVSDQALAQNLRDEAIIQGLVSNKNVVVDDFNIEQSHIDHLESIAEEYLAEFDTLLFGDDMEILLSRNKEHGNVYNPEYIINMGNRLLDEVSGADEKADGAEGIVVAADSLIKDGEINEKIASIMAMAYQNGYYVAILSPGFPKDYVKKILDFNGYEYDVIVDEDNVSDFMLSSHSHHKLLFSIINKDGKDMTI